MDQLRISVPDSSASESRVTNLAEDPSVRIAGGLRHDETVVGCLVNRWTAIRGIPLFYRESLGAAGRPVLVHVHGFGLSGGYLLPTARQLSEDFHCFVPDLPGFGRSGRVRPQLGITALADALVDFLDDRGIASATLVGNSMGCAVISEFGHRHADRLDRAVLVSPAGGIHNQPLGRAVRQLAADGLREPIRLLPVVVPDYLRFGVPSTVELFRLLTRYPTLERIQALAKPSLVVIGERDPLMPGPARLQEIAARQQNRIVMVMIDSAAHALNFSHPGELAHAIRLFMADRPITDDPDSPGRASVYDIQWGMRPHNPAD